MKSTSSKQVGSPSKNTVVLSPKTLKINSSIIKSVASGSPTKPILSTKLTTEQNPTPVKVLTHKVVTDDDQLKSVDSP